MRRIFIILQLLFCIDQSLCQKLTYNDLTKILNFNNEFDLNEYLDQKEFVYSNSDLVSDTTSVIKTFLYRAINKEEAEEAINCYYDLNENLAKVEYVFAGFDKNNKFKASYANAKYLRKFAWVNNDVNNALYYNSLYTMHYISSKNSLYEATNIYRYGLIKRYGAFDRRDGFVEFYRKTKFINPYQSQDSAFYDGVKFKDFRKIGHSREWFTEDNKHFLENYELNKFGEYNVKKSISFDGGAPLIYKSAIIDSNKPTIYYILSEKIKQGNLRGTECGKGYFNGKNGEFINQYKFDFDSNSYLKVLEIISLSNYKDSPHYDAFGDFSVQKDEVSNSILEFNINAVPNGKYYYKDDDIEIEGQYDYGLKSGIWIYKKGNEVIEKIDYSLKEEIEEN